MKKQIKQYLVACSGGPDSMALLNMFRLKGIAKAVAHVNYHKRDTAKRDEDIVFNYCKEYNIPFYKLDVYDYEGNFQDYARVKRYEFFAKIVKQENMAGVLVAHHLDDLLETYLLQKNRKSIPNTYGLSKKVIIQGVSVERPLLSKTKEDLLKYCDKYNIPYGIDESNLKDDYSRNKVRHSKIEKMSRNEKRELLNEIKRLNEDKKQKEKQAKCFINKRKRIPYDEFENYADKQLVIRELLNEDLSDKFMSEIIRQLKGKKFEAWVNDKCLVKEYGYIEVFERQKVYCYTLDKVEYKRFKEFNLVSKGTSFEGFTVKEEDLPLKIRNYKEGDYIRMRYGTKKINRFFIDHKISTRERYLWPVVENCQGEIIFAAGIGSNENHYSVNNNLFMLK